MLVLFYGKIEPIFVYLCLAPAKLNSGYYGRIPIPSSVDTAVLIFNFQFENIEKNRYDGWRTSHMFPLYNDVRLSKLSQEVLVMEGKGKIVSIEGDMGVAVVRLDSGKEIRFNMKTDGIKISGKLAAGMAVSYTLDKGGGLVSLAPESMT